MFAAWRLLGVAGAAAPALAVVLCCSRAFTDFATGGLEPDLTIWLDLPLEESLRRRGGRAADRIEASGHAFLARVAAGEAGDAAARARAREAAAAVAADLNAQVRGVMAEETAGAMYNSPYALSLAHPAFGTVATARDLLHFALHFAPTGPHLHSPAAIRTMTTDQTGGQVGPHDASMGLPLTARMPWGIGFAVKSAWMPNGFADLSSLRTYGHGGASGCQLVIDPEADAVIALVTNTHARTGREQWYIRLQSILNSVFALLN
jgi:CubicO group peptidase (beta-lactamase class C family)